jgi:hypothetical protein
MAKVKKKDKRHPMQIKGDMWDKLITLALRESRKQHKIITPAYYVRNLLAEHIEAKGL